MLLRNATSQEPLNARVSLPVAGDSAGGSFVFYRLFKYPWTFEIILEESYQQRKWLNFDSVCFYFFPEASGRASVSYGFDTVNKTEIQLAS